jgi:hypothetical protein
MVFRSAIVLVNAWSTRDYSFGNIGIRSKSFEAEESREIRLFFKRLVC